MLRLPQRAVFKPNLHHGRQDLLISKREHPSTIKSKESEEYGETRGDSNSYRGIVTQTSEYKVYHTQLFKNRMTFAEKQSRN